MTGRSRRWLLGLGVVALAGFGWVELAPRLFGLSAGYRARDGDSILTPLARTALPVIAALERFHAEHGTYPDAESAPDLAAIEPLLPRSIKVIRVGQWLQFDVGQPGRGWLYFRAERDQPAYSLSLKLGWDPRLVYRRDAASAQWVFEPGDGSDAWVIDLMP